MFTQVWQQIKISIIFLLFVSVITGIIYPLVVTGIAQVLFPWKANGSIIEQDGKPVGSELIGQLFTDDKYFWGRPSATATYPYNAEASGGSNYGPISQSFLYDVKSRIRALKVADYTNSNLVPVDLVTASGSGLDPEISPYAAFYQSHRIAKARGVDQSVVDALIEKTIRYRTFDILGESRVNVLRLNMALSQLTKKEN